MKQKRYFDSATQAAGFVDGLGAASDGSIHTFVGGVDRDPPHADAPYWVEWIDENKHAAELPEKIPPLTPQEYVLQKGAVCPMCRCRDLGGDPKSGIFDNEHARLQAYCLNPDCEASWTDCYELSGYDNLET